ncbi:MAG: hypothetical protein FWF22_04665, partial [Treponema sp.]|nr:hypothetical protein [Treponema sp.]
MSRLTLPKISLIVFCFLCAGTMAFAGGAGQQQQPGAAAGIKPTLEIGLSSNPFVIDYDTNYLTFYLEKMHNVNLQFYLLPADGMESRTKVALLVASNSLPETILGNFNTREQILEYGSNGAFISLNDYFSNPAKTPYFNQIP